MFTSYSLELSPYSQFGDVRLNRRFVQMIDQLGSHFGKSLPQSAQDNAQMQGFYRFFHLSKYNPLTCF